MADAAQQPSGEVDELVTALLVASRVLVGVSVRSLAHVDDAVTLTQFRTLVVLDSRGVINLSTLADELGVNASSAMRMVDRLLAAGLVEREVNPQDRREVRLALTPAGKRLVADATNHRRDVIANIVQAMPPAHRADIVTALQAFAAAADEPASGNLELVTDW